MSSAPNHSTIESRKRRGTPEEEVYLNESLRRFKAKRYLYKNEELTITELCEKYGKELNLTPNVIYNRLHCRGWSVVSAIETPLRDRPAKMYEINGTKKSLREWSLYCGIPHQTLNYRMKHGSMTLEEAMKLPYIVPCSGGIINKFANKVYELYGSFYSLAELSVLSDVKRETLHARLKTGMTPQQAVETPVKHKIRKKSK